jgi:hypothetical protein
VSDAALEHLDGMTQLQTLTLYHSKVTDLGGIKLQEALPKCKIKR